MPKWTMYCQDPETIDEQGYYLKEDEEKPWMTETDCEEFDAILDPAKEGFYIRDLDSANKALAVHGFKGKVVKLIWL